MLEAIAKNWWVMLIRGIAAVVFGILAFTWPGITLTVLIILFGAYALIDGISAVGFGVTSYRTDRSWWEMMLVGVLGIIAGIVAFLYPGMTAVALLVVIGVWAVIRGIFEIIAAIRLRQVIAHEWLLGIAGILSIAFGVIILARPLIGALAVVWLIGFWALLFGVAAIALSLRLQRVKHRLETHPTVPPM